MKKRVGCRKNPLIITFFITMLALGGLTIPGLPGLCLVHAEDYTAVVGCNAADYSSYAMSFIPMLDPRTPTNNQNATTNGFAVSAYEHFFYRIEQFQADVVTKYDIGDPNTAIWQYSTLDPGDTETSNPREMVFVRSSKAYIPRYGKNILWIVNPEAGSQEEFKIGEFDLSAYADGDGLCEMQAGVVVGDKLFLILQRMTRANWPNPWPAENDAYCVVIDTRNDTEINTGQGEGGLLGIKLPVRNPTCIVYNEDSGKVWIAGAGQFPSASPTGHEWTGGIASVDPDTYEAAVVVDDGDIADHPYGVITGVAVLSATQGFFVGYADWGDNSLYPFDPSTGDVGDAVVGLRNKNLSGMQSGIYAGPDGYCWVCSSTTTDAAVAVVDPNATALDGVTESAAVIDWIDTELVPTSIVFCDAEAGSGSGGGSSGSCFIDSAQ